MKRFLMIPLVVVFVMTMSFLAVGCQVGAVPSQEEIDKAIAEAVAEAVEGAKVEEEAPAVEETVKEIVWKDSEAQPGLKIPTEVPKKKVALIPFFLGHIAHTGMQMQLEKMLDEVGWEYDVFNPDLDLSTQLTIVDDVIAKGDYDYVFMNPIDSGGIIGSVEKLNEAGIPVFIWDHIPYGGKIVLGGTSDGYSGAEALSQAIIDLIIEKYGEPQPKAKVVAIINNPEVITHAVRIDALHNVFARYPNIELIIEMAPYMDNVGSIEVMKDLVSKNPDADALYSQTSYYAVGYLQALEELGRLYPVGDPNHLIFGSADGDDFTHQQIKDGYQDLEITFTTGEYCALLVQQAVLHSMGLETLQAGDAISAPGTYWDGSLVVAGSSGPYANLLPGVVTIDNVDDPQFWGNRAAEIDEYFAQRDK